ncbi:MAG: bifunctional UDP-sugar hydrolase/5'-nucleotidase [Pseudomonadota bacterium]
MSKKLLVALWLVWLMASVSGRALAEPRRITIAFTNDLESAYDPIDAFWRDDIARIGGVAELATLVQSVRAGSDVFFLFDAGDIFTGTLAKRTQGAVSFDLLGLMGYDAMVIGNHEFEYGWQVLADQKNRVPFPVLGANLFYRGTTHPYAQPWTIIERDGIRVGVIGVMGQDAATALIPSNIAGVTVLPPVEVLRPLVAKLRPQCDVIVVLTHQGETAPMQTDDESDATVHRGNAENVALAGAVDGIDLILAGHTDAGTGQPLIHPETQTAVMQTFGQGQHLGVIELELNEGDLSLVSGRLLLVNADQLLPDPAVAGRLAAYRAQHPDLYERVGQLEALLTRRYNVESTLGNAFADIVREAASAEIGLMPSGALRKDLPAGAIRRVDLLDTFPFADRIAVVELRGAVLQQVLEQGLSLERGLLQVSGVQITYDPERPVGQRATKVLIKGVPLEGERIYRVGTLEILAQGGDRYTQFHEAETVSWLPGSFADALLAAFATDEAYSVPVLGRYVRK